VLGIDLFAGAGGMSVGASAAGIDIQLAVENDPHAAATYGANHSSVELFNDDIRKLRDIDVIRRKQQLVVFGGPPCQGFSTSNQKTRRIDNPNNWLFKEFLRVVRFVQPDWVVFENVKGILETGKGVFVEQIVQKFERLGYTVTFDVLNSADFGVAQRRARFFLVASRNGVSFKFPKPLKSKAVTVDDAISDLPKLSNGANEILLPYRKGAVSAYARSLRRTRKYSSNHLVTNNAKHIIERFKHVPQGGNWEDIPARLMKNYKDRTRCHTGIYHRLCAKEPSKVIGNYRKNMLIHPYFDRGLSVREAARLQSFPDWFEFKGSIGFQQQQVGNAVPPLLAKALFNQLTKY